MRKKKTKFRKILGCLTLLGAFVLMVSAQTEKRIEEIKKIYRETTEKIAECEAQGEYSTTYLSELVVNKNNGSYPAVGIFSSDFKFYYTYGDREKNPYPNNLLKITVTTKRSAQTEFSEYLFNPSGQLIFYYEKMDENPENERRFYFASEKLIKSLKGEKNTSINGREEIAAVKTILSDKRKLAEMFQNSLRY